MSPETGVTPPAIAASVVDFPAPFGPMMQTTSPSLTVKRSIAQRNQVAVADR